MTTSSMAQMGDQQQSTINNIGAQADNSKKRLHSFEDDKTYLNLRFSTYTTSNSTLGQNHRQKKTANLEEMFMLII